MIELLILHELNKKTLTMYGISKQISTNFSVMTKPSIGTIKPALNRLELSGFLKTQKTISKGGRPSTYYSLTEQGRVALKGLILEQGSDNPINFLANSRLKLYCADVLTSEELIDLIKFLKKKTEILLNDSARLVEENDKEFYHRIVLDNINCEYKNFLMLLEGVERASKH